MIEQILVEAEEKMTMAIAAFKENLLTVRTGRAHPSLFSKIEADCYGAKVPINQLTSFSALQTTVALLTPLDPSVLRNIEQAIRESDLGVSPSNDGRTIRVAFPPFNEERRRNSIEVVQAMAEDARVSVRSIRKTAHAALYKLVMDMEAGADEVRRADTKLHDNTTAKYLAMVDEALKLKEKELLQAL